MVVNPGTVSPKIGMCRNINPSFNFAPPTREAEARATALKFVRKINGSTSLHTQTRSRSDGQWRRSRPLRPPTVPDSLSQPWGAVQS